MYGQEHRKKPTARGETTPSVVVYAISRADCGEFSPGNSTELSEGKLQRWAIATEIERLSCRFKIEPSAVSALAPAQPTHHDADTDKPCEI